MQPHKRLFLSLSFQSDNTRNGPCAQDTHGISLEPTFLFSGSLHCPGGPSACWGRPSFRSFLLPAGPAILAYMSAFCPSFQGPGSLPSPYGTDHTSSLPSSAAPAGPSSMREQRLPIRFLSRPRLPRRKEWSRRREVAVDTPLRYLGPFLSGGRVGTSDITTVGPQGQIQVTESPTTDPQCPPGP